MGIDESKKNDDNVSEAQIAVHWKEEGYFEPSKEFIAQANLTDPKVLDEFGEENFPQCYEKYADLLDWDEHWQTVLDSENPPFFKWFVGGKLNASYNCVDRHLPKYKNKTAIHFVPEPENEPIIHMTYQELYVKVNEFAAVLQDYCGLKAGDTVTLHMPMIPEIVITMLACARLGIIHSQVFSGFSGKACADRIIDAKSKYLITADSYYRAGNLIDHKEKADIAVNHAEEEGQHVEKVLIWQRYAGKYSGQTPMVEGRDVFVNDIIKNYYHKVVEPVSLKAEDTLFLMYTSGTTGKPKGAQHSIGGYLAYATGTSKYIEDIHPEDVYWCMADIGWITGHSYIVYGPLALGASSVIFEGVPTHPDAGRPWRIAEELNVNIFHTSPTAIRALRRVGADEPAKYNYHFKHMTTVGEPIEPNVWRWYYDVVGKKEAVIVDTYWQTETGGFLCSTIPGIHKMKPGSAGPGVPGIYPEILDEEGTPLPKGCGKAGNIVIRNPWPGRMLSIWGDDERFERQYYQRYCKDKDSKDWRDWPYFAGDGAVEAPDGYFRILGRIDDVINVAGHRLGTKELESAALMVDEVGEAAVVPVPDPIKGVMPHVFVSLKPGIASTKELEKKISDMLASEIGPIAKPGRVWIVPDMPKTRSGKIMRRVLGAIATRQDTGDVTTLANPQIVEEIKKLY
ncbi:MAG: acetate--CoA ligase [Bacteroidetes bacterium]|nr:acetate--CoA ligase [Bacteroidota bacterium]MBU1116996.1 acetate--CoA ligase [Bacteroidota bacterium]MBU1797332.1 acetate--CoA ligase [Bacteroidota bacterium]